MDKIIKKKKIKKGLKSFLKFIGECSACGKIISPPVYENLSQHIAEKHQIIN